MKEQGFQAEKVFHGESQREALRMLYSESADLFAKEVKSALPPGDYTLVDLGSHKGGFLSDLLARLPDYKINSIAVDVNTEDLKENPASSKVGSDIAKLPIEDKSVDIVTARYSIAWNDLEEQKEVLREIARIAKKIAIIQHQGADSASPQGLQEATRKLFDGTIPSLQREAFFFTTPEQVEAWMLETGIKFERVQDRRVDNLSDVYVEKYALDKNESEKVKEVLRDSDYVQQTTWVLKFENGSLSDSIPLT